MTATSLGDNDFFRRFWLGQAASNLGDAFGFVAMPLLVFEATHSVVHMGYVTAITGAGQLFAATFAGVLVDRVNRRALMIGCDLARLVLYGALPLLASLGALSMPMVYVVALLTGIASNIFLVTYMAAVANLVEPEQTAAANGRLQATQALTFVIGSAAAGAVCARFSPAWAMGIDALSFAASALTLLQIRFRRDRAERDPSDAGGALAQVWLGLSFLARHPALPAITLFQSVVALLGSIGLGAAVIDLIVYRLKVDLAESAATVGVSLALAALGAVLGALVAGRVGRRVGLGLVCLAGTGLQGVGLLVGGLGHGLALVIAAGMLWSGGLTLRSVSVSSLRQTLTPDGLFGRVLSAGWVLIFSASALGAILVTRAGARFGAAHAMACVGAALVLASIGGGFSALPRAGAT
jgi:Major Facilitator Superfamily